MNGDGEIQAAFCCEQGRLLRQKREHREISQAQLGALVGVHRNTIWRWEDGNAEISVWMLLRLADALSCGYSLLLPARNFPWGESYRPLLREALATVKAMERELRPGTPAQLEDELARMRKEVQAAKMCLKPEYTLRAAGRPRVA